MTLRTRISVPSKTTLGIATALATLGLAAQPSLATITAWLPAVVKIAPPASVELGKLESDTDIQAFDEQQCIQLATPLQADHIQIAAGTLVSCHFLHTDPVTPGALLLDGKARFDADIVDVISTTALLDASDPICGLKNTAYPTGIEPYRGLEAFQANDRYGLTDPRTIHLQVDVPSYSDQVRVITECCPKGQVCD